MLLNPSPIQLKAKGWVNFVFPTEQKQNLSKGKKYCKFKLVYLLRLMMIFKCGHCFLENLLYFRCVRSVHSTNDYFHSIFYKSVKYIQRCIQSQSLQLDFVIHIFLSQCLEFGKTLVCKMFDTIVHYVQISAFCAHKGALRYRKLLNHSPLAKLRSIVFISSSHTSVIFKSFFSHLTKKAIPFQQILFFTRK